jgi:hypothetical protein
MSSTEALLNNPDLLDNRSLDLDTYKAASKFRRGYPEQAVDFLARKCDAFQLLKDACTIKGHWYFKVTSKYSYFKNDILSQLSRRRILSSNSWPGLVSFSSAILGFLGSNDNSSANVIWVLSDNAPMDPKPLK